MKHLRFRTAVVLVVALTASAMLGVVVASAQQQTGSVSGVVYCDANYNYNYDAGEEIAGVTVTLYDDATCDYIPDTPALATQDSASDGTYSFTGLEVGGATYGERECYYVEADESAPELGLCKFIDWNPQYFYLYGNIINETRDFGFQTLWDKSINGQTWAPDFAVTAQTSDTIEVVDVIYLPPGDLDSRGTMQQPQQPSYILAETWNPTELALVDVEWDSFTTVISQSGLLTWTVPIYPQQQEFTATITKTFHVEPCTWASTTLQEELYEFWEVEPLKIDDRPVIVNKTPPDLWIDSTYSSEVSPGQEVAFTLSYGNNGGYENDVMIRNDFPAEGLFDSADPPPDQEAGNGSWAEWDLGDLSTSAGGSIVVTVTIETGLSPSTTIPITDSIYNHVDEIADTVVSTFHILQPPLSLGDFVWYDTNQDGIQDAGEPGVQGITVTLYPRVCGQQEMASDVTDANGNYLFEDLSPGIYCLQFANIPAGWTISPQNQGADDTVDSDADPTTAQITNIDLDVTDLDEDMGLYTEGSIGDTVFCDANSNNQFDAGEGVTGVAVTLYDDPGCDGVAVNQLAAQDSGTDGAYLFDSLPVGLAGSLAECYVVEVDETDTDLGTCTNPITPLSYAVPLDTAAPNYLAADFGFNQPIPEAASIGDFVWHDANLNGIQDAGESGVGGVTVTLYNCDGTALGNTTTAANGLYSFTNLQPGSYNLGFAPPPNYLFTLQNQGSDPALDSDADPATGRTVCTVLAEGENDMTWDAGLYEPVIEEAPPPIVPEASTLLLLGSAVSGLAGYIGLQLRARRRRPD